MKLQITNYTTIDYSDHKRSTKYPNRPNFTNNESVKGKLFKALFLTKLQYNRAVKASSENIDECYKFLHVKKFFSEAADKIHPKRKNKPKN